MEKQSLRRRQLLLKHDRDSSPRSPASTTCRVRVRNLTSLVLHAGFAACFVLQVWDQVHRFLSGEMVTVARDLVDQDLRFLQANSGSYVKCQIDSTIQVSRGNPVPHAGF